MSMASEQNSLGPTTNRLNFPDQSAVPSPAFTLHQLETLFTLLFNETVKNRAPNVSTVFAAQPDTIPIQDTPESTTTTVAVDAPPIDSPTTEEQTASNNNDTGVDQQNQEVPALVDYDRNAFFNPFAPAPTVPDIAESTSRNLDPSNMHTFYQHHPSTHHWT